MNLGGLDGISDYGSIDKKKYKVKSNLKKLGDYSDVHSQYKITKNNLGSLGKYKTKYYKPQRAAKINNYKNNMNYPHTSKMADFASKYDNILEPMR